MAEQTETKAAWSPHYTEPQVVDVRGVPVAYRRKGTGPPTVFLHGAGTTRLWLPFYERMSEWFDFVAPEHPGFGDTRRPTGWRASTTLCSTTATCSTCLVSTGAWSASPARRSSSCPTRTA